MAKDLRLFVQSFNMSRKIADENQPPVSVTEVDEGDGGHRMVLGDERKRRSDWTEYLEAEDHQEQVVTQEEEGNLIGSFLNEKRRLFSIFFLLVQEVILSQNL